MPVKHTPARRLGITTIPARVSVSFDAPLNPDGSRPITADERHALEGLLDGLTRYPATFADLVAPVAALCRRVIERHGGRPGLEPPPEWATYCVHGAGYVLPSGAAEASELDFALRVLWCLNFAQSDDIDMARRCAWDAGSIAAEAMMKFRWEPHALLGEKNLAHARRNSRAGVKQRLENKARRDQALAARVRVYRLSHPNHTRRTMAKNLLPPAQRNDGRAIDVLAKQIARLTK